MAGKESKKTPATDKALTFEEALSRLESIVTAIEQGKIGLEESIGQYERGMTLVKQCREILAKAELKIQLLQQRADGTVEAAPFDRALGMEEGS